MTTRDHPLVTQLMDWGSDIAREYERASSHSLLATATFGGERPSGEKRLQYEDYWREIPSFVFFEKPPKDADKSVAKIASALSNMPVRSRPDVIVINMAGIIVNEKLGHQFGYKRPGAFYEEWGELALAGLLLLLNAIPSASLRLQKPFLIQYLAPLRAELPKRNLEVGSGRITG